jgi:hypothetical protein
MTSVIPVARSLISVRTDLSATPFAPKPKFRRMISRNEQKELSAIWLEFPLGASASLERVAFPPPKSHLVTPRRGPRTNASVHRFLCIVGIEDTLQNDRRFGKRLDPHKVLPIEVPT